VLRLNGTSVGLSEESICITKAFNVMKPQLAWVTHGWNEHLRHPIELGVGLAHGLGDGHLGLHHLQSRRAPSGRFHGAPTTHWSRIAAGHAQAQAHDSFQSSRAAV
jgi:hypothetical protein